MMRFNSSKFSRLIQWGSYLLFITYGILIAGNYYFLLKLPVMTSNLILAGSIALLWLWVRRKEHLPRTGLEIGFLVFAGTQIIASFTSQDWRSSLENIAMILGGVVLFGIVTDWLAQGWLESHVINGLFFAAGIVCFAGFWELWTWYQPWTQLGIVVPPVSYRLQSLLSHPNITAQFLNLIVLLAMMVIVRSSNRLARVSLIGLIAACATIIFSTSSRGGWIALAIAMSLMLYLHFFSHLPLRNIKHYINEKFQQLTRWQQTVAVFLLVIGIGIASVLMYWQTSSAAKGSLLQSRSEYWPGAFQLFITHWLTGVGPGMFTRSWSLVSSLPPLPVVVHAHNMYLLVAVESGVIGLAGLLFLGGISVIALHRRWQTAPEQRWLLAVASAALVSISIHNAFDFLLNSFPLTFVLVVIGALGLTPRINLASPESNRGWRISFLALPILSILAFGVYGIWSYEPFTRGLALASQNKWEEAAQSMCNAAERDPNFGLYRQQCALAYAHTAETDKLALSKAIQNFNRAIDLDPNWAPNYLNLAMLYAKDGNNESATQMLGQAIKRAPESEIFALNLGWLAEQQGNPERAQQAYQRALNLGVNPQAVFWQQTSLRQTTLKTWQVKQNVSITTDRSIQESLLYYQDMLKQSSVYPEPYIGLARTYWKMGDNTRGDFYAREAMFIPVFVPKYLLEVIWLRAEYAERHGDAKAAQYAGLEYFTQIYDYSFQGVGTWGYANYAWFGYRREGLPFDYVPQIVRADITPEIESRIIQIAQGYAADSKTPVACIMLNRVRDEAPSSKSSDLYNRMCR